MQIKNNSDISSYPSQNAKDQENNGQQMLEEIHGRNNPHSLLMGLKTEVVALEISVENSHKAKNKPAMWPSCATP